MIIPWKTETAARNKPQLQKPVCTCKSIARVLHFRQPGSVPGGQGRVRSGPVRSGRVRKGRKARVGPSRAPPGTPLRAGPHAAARPCAGEPVAAGRGHVTAPEPGRPRCGAGGAERAAAALGGSVRAHVCPGARGAGQVRREHRHPHAGSRDVTQVLRRGRRA